MQPSIRSVYRFKDLNDRDEDLTVSNGTPCNQFSEVINALTINPVALNEILRAVDRCQKKECQLMQRESFAQTKFGKALIPGPVSVDGIRYAKASEGIKPDQLREEVKPFANSTFSVLDVAAYVALSTPLEDSFDDLLFALSEDLIYFIQEELDSMTDESNWIVQLETVLQRRLGLFESNIPLYHEHAAPSFLPKLRRFCAH